MMRRAAAASTLLLALVAMAPSAAAATHRVAVVVGNNTGHDADAPLVYAERDATRVAALLHELGHFDDIKLLIGRDAGTILAALAEVRALAARERAASDEVMFLFYYSGHGGQDGLHLGASLLEHTALLAELRAIPSDLRVVIVDACEAGAFTLGKGMHARSPVSVQLVDSLGTTGEAILASTTRSESAQESELLKGGFFTSHLLSGLRGAADRNGDGVVGLREAYEYAHDRTVSGTVVSAAGLQRPTYAVELKGSGDVPLAWPGQSRSFLQFRARSTGSFLVLSEDEDVVLAEIPATGGDTQRIALLPGSYWIKKRSTGGILVARVRLAEGVDAVLDEAQMAQIPYATLAQKGGRPPGLITVSAGMATPIRSAASMLPMTLELGYLMSFDRFGLWWSLALGAGPSGGPTGDSLLMLELRPQLALLWRRPYQRWELFYGAMASVSLYYQLVADQQYSSLGFGGDGVVGFSVWMSERVAITAHLETGIRLVGYQEVPPTSFEPIPDEFVHASLSVGVRLRF